MKEEHAALLALHGGQERQGPGDPDFAREILSSLPTQHNIPCVADLGCGTGAGALLLADWFGTPIKAVDLVRPFLDQLEATAAREGLSHLVQTFEADMEKLDWPEGSLDLIWSEGAAYHLTFSAALNCWHPLLAKGGLAVVSELTWFSDSPSEAACAFWNAAYPTMGTEAENADRVARAGFELLSMPRLPVEAWWNSYYNPLIARIESIRSTANPVMARVIEETEAEMALYRRYSDDYGYTFYVLRAA